MFPDESTLGGYDVEYIAIDTFLYSSPSQDSLRGIVGGAYFSPRFRWWASQEGGYRGENIGVEFGTSISANSNRQFVIGAPKYDNNGVENVGAVYFGSYILGTNTSGLQKIINPNNSLNAQFGFDVDIDGNFAVISALGEGKVYVYFYNSISWVLYSQLTVPGSSIGYSVSIEGNIIVVSDISINDEGQVYVFENLSGNWTLSQTLFENNCGPIGLCRFGFDIEYSDGNIIVYNANAYFIYQKVNSSFVLTQTLENAHGIWRLRDGKTFIDVEGDILVCKMYETGWSIYEKVNSHWQFCQSLETQGIANAVDVAYNASKILIGTEKESDGIERQTAIFLLK